MPDLLLHIGWPKTGTSSLQQMMRSHPNVAGKPYNRPGGDGAIRAREGLLLAERFDATGLADHLDRSQVDPRLPVIYSDEGCISMPANHWHRGFTPPAIVAERLAEATAGWDVRVLATVRDGRDLLRSTYRHAVHHGYSTTYADYVARNAADVDRGEGPFAAGRILGLYRRLFGAENVAVLPMRRLIAGDLLRVAAETLSMPALADLGGDTVPHKNRQTLGPIGAEVLVNRWLLTSWFHEPRGLRRIPAGSFRRVTGRLPGWTSAPRFEGHDQAVEDALSARFDEETGATTRA